jgi:hypothetical protein
MSNRREAKQLRQREREAAMRRPLQPLELDGESASQRRRRLSREALDATAEARAEWTTPSREDEDR